MPDPYIKSITSIQIHAYSTLLWSNSQKTQMKQLQSRIGSLLFGLSWSVTSYLFPSDDGPLSCARWNNVCITNTSPYKFHSYYCQCMYSMFMYKLYLVPESPAQHQRARVLCTRDPTSQCGRGKAEVLPLLQHHMRRVAAQMLLTSLHLWPVASPPANATCDATPYWATCGLPTKTLWCDGTPFWATCGLPK